MIKIGITGSISSGKSTVAKMIAKKKYPLFNADTEVAKLYRNKKFKIKIRKKLNIDSDKKIKDAIKKVVNKNKDIIKDIEYLVHPEIRKRMDSFMKRRSKILVFEIPLLIENKLMSYFDVLLFVNASKEIRLKRYLKKGGDKKTFSILDNRQLKASKKIKFCNKVINNNKSLVILKKEMKDIINKYE